MGRLFQAVITKPLPPNAKIDGTKVTWAGPNKRYHTGVLTDKNRVRITSKVWYAEYVFNGRTVTRSTGLVNKAKADVLLKQWEQQTEDVKAGLRTVEDIHALEAAKKDLFYHLADFQAYLEQKKRSPRHVAETVKHVANTARACGWASLNDIRRQDVEKLIEVKVANGLGANSINHLVTALKSFCSWADKNNRLFNMPLKGLEKHNATLDKRHVRRALLESDLLRLVDVAKGRPLHDALHHHRGTGEAKLHPGTRQKLTMEGETNAFCYLMLFYTGLRLGELGKLQVRSVELTGSYPCLRLDAGATKAKRGDIIPLATPLMEPLAKWIEGKGLDEFVVDVPDNLLKIFNKDLERTGIPKTDERGRKIDLHALRMSLGTNLLKKGVALVNVQKIMRHSSPTLTANLYTDVSLLDLHGAMNAAFTGQADHARPVEPTGEK